MAAAANPFDDLPDAPAPSAKVNPFDALPPAPKDTTIAHKIVTGVKKFTGAGPGSAVKLVGDTIDQLAHPVETGHALAGLYRGAVTNYTDTVNNLFGAPKDTSKFSTPQEQEAAAAAGRQFVYPFKHPLKSWEADPAGALSTLSVPATLGGSALEAAPVGALQAIGRAMTATGDLMNPATAALKVAGVPFKAAAKVMPKSVPKVEMDARIARHQAVYGDPSFAVVGGPLTKAISEFTSKGPLSFPARANFKDLLTKVGESTENTAAAFGDAKTRQLAGSDLQAGIKAYVGDETQPASFKGKVAGMYDAAFDPITQGEAAAVAKAEAAQAKKNGKLQADYQQRLEDAKAMQAGEKMGEEQGYPTPEDQKTVLPEPPKPPETAPTTTTKSTQTTLQGIKDTINSDAIRGAIQDPRISHILDVLQEDPASVRFTDLRALRTWVRNAQGNAELIQSVGKGNLDQLEGALTTDIYANADKFGGPGALRKLQRTDQFYKAGVDRINTALKPFTGNGVSGESAFSRLQAVAGSSSRADVNSLFRLKRSLQPQDWGDLQASLIDNAGRGKTGEGDFSPTQLVKWYEDLPAQSKDILFGSTGTAAKGKEAAGALRTQLDNLVSVAKDVRGVEPLASPGALGHWQLGTSGMIMMSAASGMLNPLIGGAGNALGVITKEVGALVGEAGVAQLLSSPKALRWITRMSKAAAKGSDGLKPVMASLATAAKTDAALQPVYQAGNNILNPPKPSESPTGGHEDFDPTKMTDEELRAAAGSSAPPEAATPGLHGSDGADRVAMINSMPANEAMALTMAGEGSADPKELAGIGHVIHNRMAKPDKYGATLADVLTPGEFNVWENPSAVANLKDTVKYKTALQIADDILAGKQPDITGGAHSYYAPKALAELHKTQPKKYPHERPEFAKGDGLAIGESVFYP